MSKTINRIHQFDYIRAISLIGILLCHSLFESVDYGWLGRYFALTFNFLFLILSAFIFGLAWEKKGRPPYNKEFLTNRIVKLSKTYYPYLAILFLFLFFSQDYFSFRNTVSHILYLPWFDKIDGYEHLWFMTMIVICYLGCFLMTKISGRPLSRNPLAICVLIGGGYCGRLYCRRLRIAGIYVPISGRIHHYLLQFNLCYRKNPSNQTIV